MRKGILLSLLLISLSSVVSGQKTSPDSTDTTAIDPISFAKSDTLWLKYVDKVQDGEWYQSSAMPWIVALLISLLSVFVNLFISRANSKTSSRNVLSQINASTVTANKQIDANRETTIKQINTTLNATNRQAWLNETRNVVADLVTYASLLNIEFQGKTKDINREILLHEKFKANFNKINLLLKVDKPRHKLFIGKLDEFILILDTHMLNSKSNQSGATNIPYNNFDFITKSTELIELGRDLLYDEWNTIQSRLLD